jgi:2-succinyl-5-enolpyruvyl-6-hydroxy-3-cyclohexene-1-carboxylate synthase
VVAGPARVPGLADAVVTLADALGWPVLSDPISGLRAGDHDTSAVVGSDLIAVGGLLDQLAPQAVIRVGAPPTSKALRHWLATTAVPQAVVGPSGWPDPDSSASLVIRADAPPTLVRLAQRVGASDPGWHRRWVDADRSARAAADQVIDAVGTVSEPAVARSLAAVPNSTAIWTGSSMPIRDVDSFFPVTTGSIGLFGNRGANGIDGFASTALGSAASGRPTVAHLGDVSMLHDVGALATAVRLDLPITFVVVNNDGGGIFHFLPQAGHEHFERHFGTPHGLRFCDVAGGFGLDAVAVDSIDELTAAVGQTATGPKLVEVITDRHANVALHEEITTRVQAALGEI